VNVKPYPKYKASGVAWLGDVPDGWRIVSFKREIERNDGGAWGDEPDAESGTLIVVLRSTEQTADGQWKIDDPALRKLTESEISGSLLAEGDLVVTKSSGSSLHIGKTTLVTSDVARLRCCYSNFMQRIRLRRTSDPKFAWYVMNNDISRSQFDLLSNSTTGLANLNGKTIGELVIALPSMDEQCAIASFLDRETAKIDTLIAKQEKLIELLKEKRLAVISHAVTKGLDPTVPMKPSGIEWLGDVPKHWTVSPLKHLVQTRKGVAFKADDFCDLGIQVVKASDIKNLTVKVGGTFIPRGFEMQYPKAMLRHGDIVVSTVGSTPDVKNSAVGQIGMVPTRLHGSLLNQNTVVLNPSVSTLSNAFLFLILQCSAYRDHLDLHAHGTANQASLNVADMLFFSAPLPPLSEQESIVSEVTRQFALMQKTEEAALRAISLQVEHRAALISAAVTGKIDVREAASELQQAA
jgi:type I restriction enzyme S subunit